MRPRCKSPSERTIASPGALALAAEKKTTRLEKSNNGRTARKKKVALSHIRGLLSDTLRSVGLVEQVAVVARHLVLHRRIVGYDDVPPDLVDLTLLGGTEIALDVRVGPEV